MFIWNCWFLILFSPHKQAGNTRPVFNFKRAVETAAYNSTRKNLLIDGNTKVICQGFTGKQVNGMNIIFGISFNFIGDAYK